MEKKEYIVGVDIGSSSVVMAVGERNDNGEISVLGVEVQEIEDSVKNGDIINFVDLGKSIGKAKAALEEELGLVLNDAYVGVSGKSVYCVRYEDYVEITNSTGCVTERELRDLRSRIDMVVPSGGDEIISRVPLRYCMDDHQDVKNPVGAYGRKLSATYLMVMVGKQQIDLVSRAMHCGGMSVAGLCVNPTFLPQLLLNANELEEGAVVVDLGSDVTDIAIVNGGKLWYFSSLPIGASSINSDLHDFLKIPKKDVDQLKRKYGSAIADVVDENVSIPIKTSGRAKKQILQRNIAEITEERLKDIIDFIARELKASKFSAKVPCGVILTGGSAYLANIEELFARELKMEVRLANVLYGIDDESQENVLALPHAVSMGLLLYGGQQVAHNNNIEKPKLPPQHPIPPHHPIPPQRKEQTPVQQPVQQKEQTPVQQPVQQKEQIPVQQPVKEQEQPTTPVQPQDKSDDTTDNNAKTNQEQNGKNLPPIEVIEVETNGGEKGKNGVKTDKGGKSNKKRGGLMSSLRDWFDDVFRDDYI